MRTWILNSSGGSPLKPGLEARNFLTSSAAAGTLLLVSFAWNAAVVCTERGRSRCSAIRCALRKHTHACGGGMGPTSIWHQQHKMLVGV